MGFLGVYRALYDYVPQAQGELAIEDGDLLYILDNKDDDGWWKAKKKAGADDDDEPVGLIPTNYVEKAVAVGTARALYEYTRQTDEELSFHEDTVLDVFDTSDADWILVGHDNEYGFVPANYIEVQASGAQAGASAAPAAPSLPARQLPPVQTSAQPEEEYEEEEPQPSSPPIAQSGPAAALAGVMQARSAPQPMSPPPQPARPPAPIDVPQYSDDESIKSPALPVRPRLPPVSSSADIEPEPANNQRTPGGFHMYNINEMVSVMGKKKKMPTTLGINLLTGVLLIAPEKAQDGPSQEWTAEKMTHYSREGKHVFMELVRPSKSIDFHAGAKDTAEEIVAALGEMAGAVRAEGLREVIMAGTRSSQKRGKILYDFMAQGDDEVTVATGDEVIIIDDTKSEEWWQVRRMKNGKEGVVPSTYVEFMGSVTPPPGSPGITAGMSTVEQNRAEDVRLTKEALKASKEPQQRSRHENGRSDGGSSQSKSSKSKPDQSKVRTWTDRSKSFSVEAQFLGLKDSKIHLHKMNGVKIAVPIAKMSRADLEYVENLTGISLDDEKPLADVKKSKQSDKKALTAGATVDKDTRSDYDWFQFFLSCEVAVGLCERYAQAFAKESMDESVLPDVDATILRNLGLREGDIIKVMRTLDVKFGRKGGKRSVNFAGESGEGEGGLFSGPGGTLRNNTRKGRPAPAVQTSDVVDASAFSPKGTPDTAEAPTKAPTPTSPIEPNSKATRQAVGGFDDDAWDVKPSKKQEVPSSTTAPAQSAPATAPAPAPIRPAMTGSMQDLSLLTEPLQPTKIEPQPTAASVSPTPAPSIQPALTGATPSFFSTVSQPPTGQAAVNNFTTQQAMMRQRPAPPQVAPNSSLVPPPTQRPLSAPQNAQASAFAPPALSPQMTGVVAPPGQSLNDITQARLQQQYTAQMQQPQMTGYPGMQPQGMMPFPTGQQPQFMQPMMTGMSMQNNGQFGGANQFASMQQLPPQPTGYQPGFGGQPSPFGQGMAQGSINNYLPPALQPQPTGQSMGGFGQSTSPQPMQPLVPQQTGPAPSVRFGVPAEKKLVPQATGRRANLSQATPENPFGF